MMLLLVGGQTALASAQTQTDLRTATLEELMNIEITSASRREQRVEDTPAAVYVIGHDEIRRSGLTTIPELLRLAPGVQVARVNSNKWAVSVRGFNSVYSNKLLVMVDGRSIYNPAYATVLWDTEDLMIEDVDRIEVIRGPGGAMWGANAVNGVINIITRPATETQGGFARIGGGNLDTSSAGFRYGGQVGSAAYRVYAQGATYGHSATPPGAAADDDWRSVTGGFRSDWAGGPTSVMVQASATSGRQRPLWRDIDPSTEEHDDVSTSSGAYVLGRWTRTDVAGGSLRAQTYFDTSHRTEAIGTYTRRTWDVDAQYHVTLASRHELVAGGGYRHIVETIRGNGGYQFSPNRVRPLIANVFAQDTIALAGRRVELTVGAKFEHNTFAGSGLQPNARVMWKASPRQRVWAAVARALRMPSLIDRGLHVEYPATHELPGGQAVPSLLTQVLPPTVRPQFVVGATGNPAVGSEHLVNTEAGYRLQLGARASLDVVGFSARYEDLQTLEPQAPEVTFAGGVPRVTLLTRYENLLGADTRGAEVSGRLQLAEGWLIDGAFSAFHLTPHLNGSLNPEAVGYGGHAPARQWRAHLALPASRRGQVDLHLFHTGAIAKLEVPAYTRVDARLEWSLTGRLSAIASGQNLFEDAHAEFLAHEVNVGSTLVPRSGALRLVWRF